MREVSIRNEEKNKTWFNFLNDTEREVKELCEEFEKFSDGFRMLILLERTKDGGHNKEDKRGIATRFTFNKESFERNIRELLILQKSLYSNHRLYLSVNPRDLYKTIRDIEVDLLNCHYADKEQRDNTYIKLLKAPRHWVMQPKNSIGSLFILDIDNVVGKDMHGEALKKIAELELEIIMQYNTKNGVHIVVNPFNPNLWDNSIGEIKKDGLLLLNY